MSYAEDISELIFCVKECKIRSFLQRGFCFFPCRFSVVFFCCLWVCLVVWFFFFFGNRHLSSVGQILERTLDSTLSRNLLSLERSAVCVSAFYTLVLPKVLGFLQGTWKKILRLKGASLGNWRKSDAIENRFLHQL